MNLKGNQRAGGVDQATHLLNSFDNEHVQVIEICGTVASDLLGFMIETEAVASGTKCMKPFYSLSISPPIPLTPEQYRDCISAIEKELGLTDQPRAIVRHRKKAREHYHVVWSRIDFRTMTAIHLSHDRLKLQKVRRILADKFGYDLPDVPREEPHNTLAENAQTDVSGQTPEERRFDITEAYMASDNGPSFVNALSELGYTLARGDKRGFVIVDWYGHVHSLTRQIKGMRTKQVLEKLSPLSPTDLPTVEEVQGHSPVQSIESDALPDDISLRKLRQSHAKRRAELHKDAMHLEKMQAEEMRSLQEVQRFEADPLHIRILMNVCVRCHAIPKLGMLVAALSRRAKQKRQRQHVREVQSLKRRQTLAWLELKRHERLVSLLHKKEIHSAKIAARRKTNLTGQKVALFGLNTHSMTQVSELIHITDTEAVDPEIAALEREYMQPRIPLTVQFNAISMPKSEKDEDDGKADGALDYDDETDFQPKKH